MGEGSGKITAFVRSGALELALFGYVFGIRRKLPGATTAELFRSFRKDFNLTETEMSDSAIKKAWERMQERYYDHLKTDKDEQG